MKRNKLKKIITLAFLVIFWLGLTAPVDNILAAGDISISAEKSNLKVSEYTRVTVTSTITETMGGELVYFSALGNESGLQSKTCRMPESPQIQTCSVNFNSLQEGTYTIGASVTIDDTLYEASTAVTVNGCLDPDHILIDGICRTPNTAPGVPGHRNGIQVSVDKETIKIGETATVTTAMFGNIQGIGGKVVKVSSTKSSFDPTITTCQMPVNEPFICSVELIYLTEGRFRIGSSITFNDGVLNSANEKEVTVQLNCEEGKVVNRTGSQCIVPPICEDEFILNDAQNECVQKISTQETENTDTIYTPLARLPGMEEPIDTKEAGAFGKYLNTMIKLIIGLIAVGAVVMIVIGGMEYMTSELISSKEAGKDKIRNAILGLLLALGAYAILWTINPELLNTDLVLEEVNITITEDQANFARTEGATSNIGTSFVTSGSPSSGVSYFVANYGESLDSITVNTTTKRADFCSGSNCVSVPINIGLAGFSEIGEAKEGDLKTPKGTTAISGDRRIGNNGNAALSLNGYNLGAAFINIGATVNGKDRGIGFHGSYNNNLGTTNGCIRMKNDDLLKLAPHMKAGIRVVVR